MSTIAWVDYDEKQRRAVKDLIKMYASRDTVDEMGTGVVRDALSELFFKKRSSLQLTSLIIVDKFLTDLTGEKGKKNFK